MFDTEISTYKLRMKPKLSTTYADKAICYSKTILKLDFQKIL